MPFEKGVLLMKEVDHKHWSIQQPLIYKGRHDRWVVPRGFITDYATVPRFATWLVPITGVYTRAVILHDWFCKYAIQAGLISARDADGVFRRILREEGTPELLRWLVWTGVRWGALFSSNSVRRQGWHRDAFPVIMLSLLFAPFVLPAMLSVGLGFLVWMLLETIVYVIGKGVRRWFPARAESTGSSTDRGTGPTARSGGGGSARRSRR